MDESGKRMLRSRTIARRAETNPYARPVDINADRTLDEEEDDFLDENGSGKRHRGFFTRVLSYIPLIGRLVAESSDSESDEAETDDLSSEYHESSSDESDEEQKPKPRKVASHKSHEITDNASNSEEEAESKWFQGVKTLEGLKNDFKPADGTIFERKKEESKQEPRKEDNTPEIEEEGLDKALYKKTIVELKADLHAAGLSVGGKKEDLVKRLEKYFIEHPSEKIKILNMKDRIRVETEAEEKSLTPVKRMLKHVNGNTPSTRPIARKENSRSSTPRNSVVTRNSTSRNVTPRNNTPRNTSSRSTTPRKPNGKKSDELTKVSTTSKHLKIAAKNTGESRNEVSKQSDVQKSKQSVNFTKSGVTSPMSTISTIKEGKTITYEEYEKLSAQLRKMVEKNPHTSLRLVQNALSEGFDESSNLNQVPLPNRTSYSAPDAHFLKDYVPGSVSLGCRSELTITEKDKRAAEVDATWNIPFGKRSKLNDTTSSSFRLDSGYVSQKSSLTKDERKERRPRPSRLLTGLGVVSKRDLAARSAYSAAVADKILSTLKKMQSPLEIEVTKPTPSSSLSWAKYHLAVSGDNEKKRPLSPVNELRDGTFPPVSALPKVVLTDSSSLPTSGAPSPVFTFSLPRSTEAEPIQKKQHVEPPKKPTQVSLDQTAPKIPHAVTTSEKGSRFGQENITQFTAKTKNMGKYTFTLPAVKCKKTFEDDGKIKYLFSPPPNQREPPKVTSSGKKATASATKPFDFVASSPKGKTEGTFPHAVKSRIPGVAPTTKASSTETTSNSASCYNPLAKFAQIAPGSWKCPTCAVVNLASHSKCPCCETDKPVDTQTNTLEKPSAYSEYNPLAKFTQFEPGSWKCPTCAVTNGSKQSKCPCCETDKPGEVENTTPTSTSFSFGAPSASQEKSSGFSFGVTSPSTRSDSKEQKSNFSLSTASAASETSGFSFAAGFGGSDATKPAFSFGMPEKTEEPQSKKPNFSFGVSSNIAKSENETTTKPSFSFGVNSTPVKKDESKAIPAFSFGTPAESKSSAKRKSVDSPRPLQAKISKPEGIKDAPKPSFSFGSPLPPSTAISSSTASFGTSKTDTDQKPSFSFGGLPSDGKSSFTFGMSSTDKPESVVATSLEKEVEAPKPSFAFDSTDNSSVKPVGTTKPSFGVSSNDSKPASSFTASVAQKNEEQKEAAKPAFTFGTSSVTTSENKAEKPSEMPKPAFAFGASKIEQKKEEKPADVAKPAFTFGASSGAPPANAPGKLSFTFGGENALADISKDTSAAKTPAFTFGQSASDNNSQSSFGSGSTTSSTGPSFTFGAPSSTSTTTPGANTFSEFGGASGRPVTSTPAAPAPSAPSFGSSTSFGNQSTHFGGFGASAATTTPGSRSACSNSSSIRIWIRLACTKYNRNYFWFWLTGPCTYSFCWIW
jgi:nuclear pore complex protein Nup153